VQSKGFAHNGGGGDPDPNTTVTLTFDTALTVGNVVVGAIYSTGTPTISSITAGGNTGAVLSSSNIDGNSKRSWLFTMPITASGQSTITVTYSTSVSQRGIMAHEVSGQDTATPVGASQYTGQHQATPTTSTDAQTSGAITTTRNGCYIFGAYWDSSAGCGGSNIGTGYSAGVTVACNNSIMGKTEYLIQSSAGSIAATYTASFNQSRLTHVVAVQPSVDDGISMELVKTWQ
jgi:hypothetical protein